MTSKESNMTEYVDYQGRAFVEKCTDCGLCLEACPLFPMTKYADRGAVAIIRKITYLLKGGEVSEEAYDMLYSCSGACGRCAKACPEGLAPSAAFMLAIAKMSRAGWDPPPLAYQTMPRHRYNFASVFSSLQTMPSERRWITKVPENPKQAELVFFTGCGAAGLPHVALEAMDILDKMGVDFVGLGGGEICCGIAAMLYGDTEAVYEVGQKFVDAIAAFQPKKAVFFCTGCHMACLAILPPFMEIPFQSYEITQFLVDNLDKIPFTNPVNKVVAVHDSCSVARLGTYEPTRTLLQAIPGVTLVEMEHNRDNALCCGGAVNMMRPEITGAMRRAPLDEAKAAGAEILATLCTGCQENFAPMEQQYPFEVRNYISLVAQAVGVQHEDRFKPLVKGDGLAAVMARSREYIEASDFTVEEMERILPDYLDRFCGKHGK
ncbi:(Fe-S)-binding protein [Chloroflexota bacterium]